MKKIIVTTTYSGKLSPLNTKRVFKSFGDFYADKRYADYLKKIACSLADVDGPFTFTYKPKSKEYIQITITIK